MLKKFFIVAVSVLLVVSFCSQAFAGLIDWERRNRYLQSQEAKSDGTVKMTEADIPQWMTKEPRVTTEEERRYDVNRDGYLQPAESKVYLRRVVTTVEKRGKVVFESEILKEYDQNGDGVITKTEASNIRRDAF